MTISSNDQNNVEEFREQLQLQMRDDFFNSIKNPEDPMAERTQLIAAISAGLERLLDVEAGFINEMLDDVAASEDSICPRCLMNNSVDLANVKAVATLFNHYLSTAECTEH